MLPVGWRHTYVTVCSIALQSLAMSRLMLMFFNPNSAFFKNSTLKELSMGGGLGHVAAAEAASSVGGGASSAPASSATSSGPGLLAALRKTKVAAD